MSLVDHQILIELTKGVNGHEVKTVDDTSYEWLKSDLKYWDLQNIFVRIWWNNRSSYWPVLFFCEVSCILSHPLFVCSHPQLSSGLQNRKQSGHQEAVQTFPDGALRQEGLQRA